MSWIKCIICEGKGIDPHNLEVNTTKRCPTCKGSRIISIITGLPPDTANKTLEEKLVGIKERMAIRAGMSAEEKGYHPDESYIDYRVKGWALKQNIAELNDDTEYSLREISPTTFIPKDNDTTYGQ